MGQKVKVLLVGRYYIIEPLGLMHLAGLASSIGCEVDVELISHNDFTGLYRRVEEWKPDFVGFQIWTGWHLQTFTACDMVRTMGSQVIIGGPHVTYFTEECARHADFVVRGDGFRTFRRILQGEIMPGIHFDVEQLAEGFPMPNRSIVYGKYPVLRNSPIRSEIASIGCPFGCFYCYGRKWNEMYGGFRHTQRPMDDIIREGIEIRDRWGAKMVYFQDDIFGFDHKVWLSEFSRRWRKEIGIPFHCQIRLELIRGHAGDKRLDLFKEAGCTGLTVAIESGDAFLREYVLNRPMPNALILEGCAKIRSRGMTLRTEQILAVPFSNLETDLSTLRLNCRINPEMAWTSILSPYGGTEIDRIAKSFGFYNGTNDEFEESFFDRSVLRHSETAREAIEAVMNGMGRKKKQLADLAPLCQVEFMDDKANARYKEQIIIHQRLFNWLSKVPQGDVLAEKFLMLSREQWTWKMLGEMTRQHLESLGMGEKAKEWVQELIHAMGCSSFDELHEVVRENPYYFVFFPSSAEFAQHVVETGALDNHAIIGLKFDTLWAIARQWLFVRSLYKIEPTTRPIAG